jgi:hypothetical protein
MNLGKKAADEFLETVGRVEKEKKPIRRFSVS